MTFRTAAGDHGQCGGCGAAILAGEVYDVDNGHLTCEGCLRAFCESKSAWPGAWNAAERAEQAEETRRIGRYLGISTWADVERED